MKLSLVTLGTQLLAALIFCTSDARVLRVHESSCETTCRTYVMQQGDIFCQAYRNLVPRPTLFSRCTEAYSAGKLLIVSPAFASYIHLLSLYHFIAVGIGCKQCNGDDSDLLKMFDNVIHYCEPWDRGYPKSYVRACQAAYRDSLQTTESFIRRNGYVSSAVESQPLSESYISDATSPESTNVWEPEDNAFQVESAASIVQRNVSVIYFS